MVNILDRIPEEDFITLEDGFVYYWPSGSGGLSEGDLIVIADELRKRNAEWNTRIVRYFTSPLEVEHCYTGWL